jgi:hypothetical protein
MLTEPAIPQMPALSLVAARGSRLLEKAQRSPVANASVLLYWKGITFRTGRPNVRSQMEPVLDLCTHGFDPSILETVIAPFEQAPDAFLDDAISVAISRP